MLYCNVFPTGEALLEREPQGDSPILVPLTAADERALVELLVSVEASALLARLFLAGALVSERATADEIPF